MAKRKTLNEQRLTRKQVAHLVSAGARQRPDLMASFREAYPSGHVHQPKVYELDGDRFLFVFPDDDVSMRGLGDIYPGDYFRRFASWQQRVRDDELSSRSSVSHWLHYSKLKADLPSHVDRLIAELANAVRDHLDFSYASLDLVSAHAEALGINAATSSYDQLVAYVGEVMRRRTQGSWKVRGDDASEVYPCIFAERHAVLMPINVVWQELSGIESPDLRRAAANEVRSARARAL